MAGYLKEKAEHEMIAEKSIVWTTENLPLNNCGARCNGGKIDSPIFECGTYKCYLRLHYSPENPEYHVVSLMSKGNVPHSLNVTTYLEDVNGIKFFQRKTARKFPNQLLRFPGCEGPRGGHYERKWRLKFVVIFHDNSLTLCDERNPDLLGLSNDMYAFLNESSSHNVQVRCGSQTLVAHMMVLSARSPTFQDFLKNTNTLHLDMDAETGKAFLRYLYTGKLSQLNPETARLLKRAAKKFKLFGLFRWCSDYFISWLSEDNAFDTLISADVDNDDDLKMTVIDFIIKKGMAKKNNEKWLSFLKNQHDLAVEVLLEK